MKFCCTDNNYCVDGGQVTQAPSKARRRWQRKHCRDLGLTFAADLGSSSEVTTPRGWGHVPLVSTWGHTGDGNLGRGQRLTSQAVLTPGVGRTFTSIHIRNNVLLRSNSRHPTGRSTKETTQRASVGALGGAEQEPTPQTPGAAAWGWCPGPTPRPGLPATAPGILSSEL